jgi:type IV pilus assembly protein PilA
MGKNGKGSYQEFWVRWMTIDLIKRHIENHRDEVHGKQGLFILLNSSGLKNFNSGFTLIELLVVIAIIGILAAVAMVYYRGYIIKAKLTEVEHAMAVVGSAVSAYHHDNEDTWPNCPSINEVRNSLGVGLGSVSRISALSIVNGTITATIQNIHPTVDGKQITLTPTLMADGSISWTWGWSADFPSHLKHKPPKGTPKK